MATKNVPIIVSETSRKNKFIISVNIVTKAQQIVLFTSFLELNKLHFSNFNYKITPFHRLMKGGFKWRNLITD